MAEWDTLAIQERVLRDARVPRGALYSTLDNLLPLLDQHLRTVITPRLLDAGADYLAATQSYAVTAGQGVYRLPTRSLRLLEVTLLDASGRPTYCFSRATSTQVTKFRAYGRVRPSGTPEFWWFEASAVQLYPTPSATDGSRLVLRYARRPSRLVSPEECGTIIFKSPDGSLAYTPESSFDSPLAVDVVKGTPGFESVADNAEVVSSGPGTVTLDVSLLPSIDVGDYLCLPGTSPVPQVPLDYLTALERSVVAQLLRSNGDLDAATAAEADMRATLDSAASDFSPRADEATTVVQQDW